MRRALLSGFVLALASCSSSPAELSITVTAGQEKDAFTASPAVDNVTITVTSLDGSVNAKTTVTPGSTFDLGDVKDDQQISVDVTGTAAGAPVLRGRSMSGVLLGSIEGGALPVFVQRTGTWARPPDALPTSHVGGCAAMLDDRYTLLTGGALATGDTKGDVTEVDGYDFFALAGTTSATLPRVPQTIVSLGTMLVLIDKDGASVVDFTTGNSADWGDPPTGLTSWADVAGGRVIDGSNGQEFVVGATRGTSPSTAVLEVALDSDGNVTMGGFELTTARQGAAATWVDGVGLVVAGGSDDPKSAGIEVLLDGAASFSTRAFAPDPVAGAAAVTDGAKGVVLVGGTLNGMPAPTRRLDPSCVVMCAAQEVTAATPDVALTNSYGYALGGSNMLLLGDEASGMGLVRTFLVDWSGSVTEKPLREPRKGATPTPTPTGTLVLLGGEHPDGTPAVNVEVFFPEVQ